jgi:uncharacterized protein
VSDLCLDCGLCCNGTVFSHVGLKLYEITNAPMAELKVERRGHRFHFFQPCPAHRDDGCSVYDRRPDACQRFECDLLKDVQLGRIALAQARQVVADTKQRARSIEEHVAPPGPTGRSLAKRILNVAERALTDPSLIPESFVDDALALNDMLRTHFRRAGSASEALTTTRIAPTPEST